MQQPSSPPATSAPEPRKLVLVAGATGKQGQALIRSLHRNRDYHIWALTRSLTSPPAMSLAAHTTPEQVTVVEGDLDKPETIRKLFDEAKGGEYGGVWGVYCVLQFPGLGANADGEEAQGKNLAELAAEFGVTSFVFSSVERGGEYNDDNAQLDRKAKVMIERHIKALGESKGLPWTILRPGFFMENYDGTVGSIAVGVLKKGLKPTTTVLLVAAEDIGRVGAAILRDPTEWRNQILVVSGEASTMAEQSAAYKRATGKSLPAVPGFVAAPLIALNGHTKALIADIERVHMASTTGLAPDLPAQIAAAKRAFPELQTFETWARERGGKWGNFATKKQDGQTWNEVRVGDLVRGKQ